MRTRTSPLVTLIAKAVGTRLRAMRKARRLTMEELASASGVDTATISRIERGKMVGTLECHFRLAAALGISLAELYTRIQNAWLKETMASAALDGEPAAVFQR